MVVQSEAEGVLQGGATVRVISIGEGKSTNINCSSVNYLSKSNIKVCILQLWAHETLEPTPEEAIREYWLDIKVHLFEWNQHVPIGHMEN